ncbi:hypothetical protein F2Q69_00054468 [Brassica cretica]|uniref:Uncharacterized protein n=1 Tax=Brassica cretica TaxID=69181 RepID=A0A8S9MYN2_BRACR|nr:hypothetical protein F2Q69_00054468 [Brassica cretica]
MEDNKIREERNASTKGKAKGKCLRRWIQSGSRLQIGSLNLTTTKTIGVATVEKRKALVTGTPEGSRQLIIKTNAQEFLQVFAEEEIEEEVKMQEVMTEELEEKKKIEDMEGKDGVTGEVEKRQGTRKKVVKPSLGAAASNKLKMAQLVAAKRAVAKPGIRHGDHSKQGEEKGTSGPKHDPAKQAKDP